MDRRTRVLITAALLVVGAVILTLILLHKFSWACGFLTGSAWSVLNFLLTVKLFRIAILRESKSKLMVALLVKFPVLYFVGFIILTSHLFPVSSLLAGLVTIVLVVGGLNVWPKLT